MVGVNGCYLSCETCGRSCRWSGRTYGRQTHRFDCCGLIRAHVPYRDGVTWSRNGMAGGYLTGPSQTTRRTR